MISFTFYKNKLPSSIKQLKANLQVLFLLRNKDFIGNFFFASIAGQLPAVHPVDEVAGEGVEVGHNHEEVGRGPESGSAFRERQVERVAGVEAVVAEAPSGRSPRIRADFQPIQERSDNGL